MGFNALQDKIKQIEAGNGLNFLSLNNSPSNKIITDERLLQEGWLCNEDVYAVVSRLALLVSSLPITLMNGDNTADPLVDPFAQFFYSEWNTKRGLNAELYRVVMNLSIYGRAYTYKKLDEETPLGFSANSLWTLNTRNVTPYCKDYSYFENADYYTLNTGTRNIKIDRSELIVVDNASLETSENDGYISPIQSVFNTVTAENNRSHAEGVMLNNRGVSGFISPKSGSGDSGAIGFTSKVMDSIRASFANLTGGSSKFNKVEVIEKATEFTSLGMSASDLKIVEMRLNHVRSICNAFGVPSLLFNDYQSRTHSNYDTALKSMYTDAVIPIYKKWENQFNKEFLIPYNKVNGTNYTIKLQMNEIEALNRSVADVFTNLNPQIAMRLMDNMNEADLKALLIDLGLAQ